MDEQTRSAYASHADEIARRHHRAGEGVARYFSHAFRPDDRILDVGSGSGRDLAALVSEGWTAYGVEPIAEMRAQALATYPHLDGLLVDGELPDGLTQVAASLDGPFDGVICSAVLQHLPRPELFDAVFALRRLLRPGGRLLVSVPVGRPGLDASGRDALGRLFTGLQAGELELLCQRVGFQTLDRWDSPDSLDRDGIRWATILFRLEHEGEGGSPRPLDRIEAVLRRDKKSSTYKFALLRALTEIATTRSRLVRWRPDGRVAVPVDTIAELWLEYYWPIFESSVFLPQAGGETRSRTHKSAFAKQLNALRRAFRGAGGLPALLTASRQGALRDEHQKLLREALGKIARTVRDMPVKHAGVSTTGALFGFEKGHVLVSGDLWRELSLMSHWVHDSLLVRWAELIDRFASAGGLVEGVREHALGILLEPALDERQTVHARNVYETISGKQCTWSGRGVDRAFDVDHIIPFALWRSNDLWNLVPAAKSVNNAKSDRLPTRPLLHRRRSVVLDYWQQLREALPRQFDAELTHLTGSQGPDYEAGYEALVEAVETTALQRGAERWEG